ncbi:MAG: hypothetical protein PHO57_10265 [Acidithiobacillus sp.]|nr:hypothetical protein [Acidithiobacillus sp.]
MCSISDLADSVVRGGLRSSLISQLSYLDDIRSCFSSRFPDGLCYSLDYWLLVAEDIEASDHAELILDCLGGLASAW